MHESGKTLNNTRRIVLTGLFTACAFAVNIAESAFPMPLPGVKLGLANAVALCALVLLGAKEAFIVTLLRVFLSWLASGNVFSLACSLGGAVPAVAVMSLLYGKLSDDLSMPWISVAGAWAFNAGQIAVVSYIVKDLRIAFYILPLLVAGTAAGWATGLLAQSVCKKLGGKINEDIDRQ